MLNILWVAMIVGGIVCSVLAGNMDDVTRTLIDSSSEAVNLCIFMAGIISVWNGLMEVAVESGLMKSIAGRMQYLIHWLFPDIPSSDPANEYIAANMAANVLGLSWAATPAGLKAMQALKKLQENQEGREVRAASDMMCAFLVLNISSLQLIPINMIAYRSQYGSAEPGAVILPAICATTISTLAGILFIKLMSGHRRPGRPDLPGRRRGGQGLPDRSRGRKRGPGI